MPTAPDRDVAIACHQPMPTLPLELIDAILAFLAAGPQPQVHASTVALLARRYRQRGEEMATKRVEIGRAELERARNSRALWARVETLVAVVQTRGDVDQDRNWTGGWSVAGERLKGTFLPACASLTRLDISVAATFFDRDSARAPKLAVLRELRIAVYSAQRCDQRLHVNNVLRFVFACPNVHDLTLVSKVELANHEFVSPARPLSLKRLVVGDPNSLERMDGKDVPPDWRTLVPSIIRSSVLVLAELESADLTLTARDLEGAAVSLTAMRLLARLQLTVLGSPARDDPLAAAVARVVRSSRHLAALEVRLIPYGREWSAYGAVMPLEDATVQTFLTALSSAPVLEELYVEFALNLHPSARRTLNYLAACTPPRLETMQWRARAQIPDDIADLEQKLDGGDEFEARFTRLRGTATGWEWALDPVDVVGE